MAEEFLCHSCRRHRPVSGRQHMPGTTRPVCAACHEKIGRRALAKPRERTPERVARVDRNHIKFLEKKGIV